MKPKGHDEPAFPSLALGKLSLALAGHYSRRGGANPPWERSSKNSGEMGFVYAKFLIFQCHLNSFCEFNFPF